MENRKEKPISTKNKLQHLPEDKKRLILDDIGNIDLSISKILRLIEQSNLSDLVINIDGLLILAEEYNLKPVEILDIGHKLKELNENKISIEYYVRIYNISMDNIRNILGINE